ncbi:phage major capsid protein [Roseobacter litoralis]|uniref:phage major capsid protein n=1 Tax=Roseobacter litoralis TaxID=42443 RepID=UPI002490D209|nr:phage major capsid protein [Roseobacter litoralis]
MSSIPTTNDLAARKNAAEFFNTAGVKSLNDITPHRMDWKDLRAVAASAARHSRSMLDRIKDNTPAERAKEIETAFDGLMALHRACEDEMDVRNEIGNREPRDQEATPEMLARRPNHSAQGSGVDDGTEYNAVDLTDPQNPMSPANWLMRSTGSRESRSFKAWAQAKGGDQYRGLSLGRYLRSMIVGAETDIERRALAEGTDSTGGFTTPTPLSAQLIDNLRAASVVNQAGAITMPLSSDNQNMAKLLTDPVPGWREENAQVTESDPTFGNVPMAPKSLAVMVKVSYELMQDSVNLERELPRILSTALAQELDRVALLGSGSAPEPLGIVNTSGISTAAFDAELTNYGPFVTGRTAVLSANAGPTTAIIMHPRDEGRLIGMSDGNAQPLMAPKAIEEIPMLTTTAIPIDGGSGNDESTIIMGNFAKLMIGIRSDIRVEVSRSYAMDRLQYVLVAHMRADVAVQHASGFHAITGVGKGT